MDIWRAEEGLASTTTTWEDLHLWCVLHVCVLVSVCLGVHMYVFVCVVL